MWKRITALLLAAAALWTSLLPAHAAEEWMELTGGRIYIQLVDAEG